MKTLEGMNVPNDEIESQGIVTDDYLWYQVDVMFKALQRLEGQLQQLKTVINERITEKDKGNELLHIENEGLRAQLQTYKTQKE